LLKPPRILSANAASGVTRLLSDKTGRISLSINTALKRRFGAIGLCRKLFYKPPSAGAFLRFLATGSG
jgi:hypothetical protein